MEITKRSYIGLSLAFLLFAIVSLVGIYYVSYQNEQKDYIESLSISADHKAVQVSEWLNKFKRDVIFLHGVPPIQGLIRAKQNGGIDPVDGSSEQLWRSRLASIFSTYLLANESVYQVRYVGVASNGKELVRVDKINGNQRVIQENQLQEKAGRDYFAEIVDPKFDGIYISHINLNRENGEVQIPYRPTVRIAMKVFAPNNDVYGFVIININIQEMFDLLNSHDIGDASFYLLDEQGNYLVQPKHKEVFGFDLGQQWNWDQDYEVFSLLDKNSNTLLAKIGQKDVIVSTKSLSLVEGMRSLMIRVVGPVDHIRTTALYESLQALFGIVVLVCIGLFYFYLYRLSASQREIINIEKARIASIVEGSQDAIIGVSLDGLIMDWNSGATDLLGYQKEEMVGVRSAEIFLTYEQKSEYDLVKEKVIDGQLIKPFETVVKNKKGEEIFVSVSASAVKEDDQSVVGMSTILRDISEQKKAEHKIKEMNASLAEQVEQRVAELAESNTLQQAILQNADVSIIATDTQGVIQLFNPASEKMLDYKEDEVLEKLTPAVFHLESEVVARAQEFSKELHRDITPGFDVFVIKSNLNLKNEHEWTYVKKDGTHITVNLNISTLKDDSGNITGYLGIASDITQQALNRRKLEMLKNHLSKASEVAELGIWTWRVSSNDLNWNSQMYDIYGLNEAKISPVLNYDHWYNALAEEQREEVAELLQKALEGKGGFDTTFEIKTPEGQRKHIRAAAVIERDEDDAPVMVLGINFDITKQVHYERNLKEAKEAADLANKTKSDFVANMSHEIRTPMNAIIGLMALMEKTGMNEKQADYIEKASASAHSLLRIINDILDFSKVEAGKLEIDNHPFRLTDLIDNVCPTLATTIGNKEIEFIVDLDPSLPSFICLDSLRLQQIITNLVSNAIKFTDQGFVKLTIAKDQLNSSSVISCSIQDTGIGMRQDYVDRLFEEFSQAEASTVRQYGGTGLGLAISKKLVELMGGEIKVESEFGTGTTFSFYIPFEEGDIVDDFTNRYDFKDLKVLIADDHEEARLAIKNIVESLGWQATLAKSGIDAIEIMTNHQAKTVFDLVLLDFDMPILNGLETAQKLHKLNVMPEDSKIFIITGYGKELTKEMQEFREGVVDAIIEKPLIPSKLVDNVLSTFSNRLSKLDLSKRSGSKRITGTKILLVEDNEINRLVATEILEGEGAIITNAVNGQDAINVLEANEGNFDIVLMDVQMPVMDGYEATRIIREQKRFDALPIVAMTANVMQEDKLAAQASGMNDHVSKPINVSELLSAIVRNVQQSHSIH